jgi:hypothetical protein
MGHFEPVGLQGFEHVFLDVGPICSQIALHMSGDGNGERITSNQFLHVFALCAFI